VAQDNVLCFSGGGCSGGFLGISNTPMDCCNIGTHFVRQGAPQCEACADIIAPDGRKSYIVGDTV